MRSRELHCFGAWYIEMRMYGIASASRRRLTEFKEIRRKENILEELNNRTRTKQFKVDTENQIIININEPQSLRSLPVSVAFDVVRPICCGWSNDRKDTYVALHAITHHSPYLLRGKRQAALDNAREIARRNTHLEQY
ncbi:hypothetical protein CAPTEDRAFT_209976 [Capitella teleta]|uniref:Uncharacterized protein n=1 Tax=Capitella teleta TaxID=283909 RepID=R7VGE8_CAPTE|nr:hypothetical protein CAPTEDRAFT_209976 [Capitella teleta]|eukprot:ELU14755.1 hypothetical protein CAPTEDRAFT_209976 [Capitella teleta]